MMGRVIIVLLLLLPPGAARAAALVADISKHQIEITSSYAGTTLLLFGAIDWSREWIHDPKFSRAHDIIVVIRGPATPLQIRRKEQIAGVWLNRHVAVAGGMPSYYVLASTRPVSDMLLPEEVKDYGLGIDHLSPRWEKKPPAGQEAEFAAAARRRMVAARLYTERPSAVQVLSATLFRTEVYFPVNVPVGRYTAEVFLVRDGLIVARQSAPLSVDKIGLERAIYDFAHTHPAWYGLFAVLLALVAGMTAGAISRRFAR